MEIGVDEKENALVVGVKGVVAVVVVVVVVAGLANADVVVGVDEGNNDVEFGGAEAAFVAVAAVDADVADVLNTLTVFWPHVT